MDNFDLPDFDADDLLTAIADERRKDAIARFNRLNEEAASHNASRMDHDNHFDVAFDDHQKKLSAFALQPNAE